MAMMAAMQFNPVFKATYAYFQQLESQKLIIDAMVVCYINLVPTQFRPIVHPTPT
ncbi:hypothetical protein VCRA2116O29_610021 [Vibrio crassostreae]|nr:hypothetical protein VCRA2116O29_610021 [Vibrio crassostreae]CAK2593507.1 hypothetical protein VCRA217O317_110079 [Vibrio crassostreae]CAK3246699.1 hypothetical protein VCRA2127O345_170033 [Vibrio crassostreae]CAK3274785.1 hypothetical protein VCRA2120E330_180071 [Vibrio crassostreae]CAK3351352.1 hypothetical protein VCRA2122O340_170034 [Vibrio crassostreae]